jgi:tetratricopeptide (TPR) repeat protein
MPFAAGIIICVFASTVLMGQMPILQEPPRQRDLGTSLNALNTVIREDPHRAVRMLWTLDREYPDNPDILNLLGDAYQALGQVDSAMVAYDRCLTAQPGNARASAALGTLYLQKGDRDKGEAVFRDLLLQAGPSMNTYRTIGSTLGRAGFYDLALRWYEEGREKSKPQYLLTFDIAQLRKTTGDFEGALDEYVSLFESSPNHYPLARDRILELMEDPRANAEALLSRLSNAAEKSAQREMVMNTLALAYLQQGMLENALEKALEAEKVKASDGKVLLDLAEKTVGEYKRRPREEKPQYFDMALRALGAFIDGHPRSPEIPTAKLMLVNLLVDLASGRVNARPGLELETATAQAIEALDWMITTYPNTDNAEEAYLKKGDVVFRLEKRPRDAIEIYKEGLAKARYRPIAFAERLGRLYLVVGDYDNAGKYFTQLVKRREPELHEAGVYYTGLLFGIRGEYEAAKDTLSALAESNPSSPFTNDAIDLAWAIEEGLQGDQKVLGGYVDALEYELAEDTTKAIDALNGITARPAETPLRSRSLLRIGELYQGSRMFDQAVGAFESFIRDYPKDVRVPDAERRIGQVYEYGYGDTSRALGKYEDILLSYPHYIFLDDVRQDVTRLRSKAGASG